MLMLRTMLRATLGNILCSVEGLTTHMGNPNDQVAGVTKNLLLTMLGNCDSFLQLYKKYPHVYSLAATVALCALFFTTDDLETEFSVLSLRNNCSKPSPEDALGLLRQEDIGE
jgi:hypothetical protein